MKFQLEDIAVPLAKLLGHSLAAAIGFVGLGAISLIPIAVLKILVALGIPELVQPLRALGIMLLLADIALFAVIFVFGAVVFAVDTISAAKRRIDAALKDTRCSRQ